MSQVLHLKRDPNWLTSLALVAAETVILLQSDAQRGQVSVPAHLLLASSSLVRNILSADHLPPAFSTPVISIPSVSLDILESVEEMLVSGMAARMDRTRLSGVREVLKILGINDCTVIQTESGEHVFGEDNICEIVGRKTLGDKLENLVSIKSEENIPDGPIKSENVKLEIIVQLEREPKVEYPILLLNQTEGHSSQSCLKLEAIKNKTINEKILESKTLVQKQQQVHHERVNHAKYVENSSPEANQEKEKKQAFCRHISQEKHTRKIWKSCPLCEKNMFGQNLPLHIRAMHNKEKCPHSDKILSSDSLKRHMRTQTAEETTVICPQCEKKLNSSCLSRHIRVVHNKETDKCLYCDKIISTDSLKRHIRIVHKDKDPTVICPQCEKTFSSKRLSKHIRVVHNKETAKCTYCDKILNNSDSLKTHVRNVHEQTTVKCQHCKKKLDGSSLSKHIRVVHNKETEKFLYCDKILSIESLKRHNRIVHETVKCPQCKKKLSCTSLSKHIRAVHKKETVNCPHCDKKLNFKGLPRHIRNVHK